MASGTMKRPNRAAAWLMILAVALTGCAPQQDFTLTPSSSPGAPARAGLVMVALGDSLALPHTDGCAGCVGYPAVYARTLSAATGRPVKLINLAEPDLSSRHLGDQLIDDTTMRTDVADADIVTITIGHNDTPWVSDEDPCDADASADHANWTRYTRRCVRQSAQRFRVDLDRILAEVRRLRLGEPTAIRVTNFYNDIMGDPLADPGGDDASKMVVDEYSAVISRSARAHHLDVADIYHAFNGPVGRQFDGPYVANDHVHPSAAGEGLIAHTLADLGYAPLA